MTVKRKFYSSGFQHICQKSADNGILFYNVMDFIVLFTIMCVKSVQNNVCIIAICLMLNHFHIEAIFDRQSSMSRYMNGVTSVFARAYNKQYHSKGQVFKRPFKNVPKYSEQKTKDCFIYISNNPVVKKAVRQADQYQWNFLKYLESPAPFSEAIDPLTASADLLELMKEIKTLHSEGQFIGYKVLDKRLFQLNPKEQSQLIDFIINTYNVIDKKSVFNMYESYEQMITAMTAVSGREFDDDDDISNEDYKHYFKMMEIAQAEGYDLQRTHFRNLIVKDEKLSRFHSRCKIEAKATEYEISKFLHIHHPSPLW